MKTRMQLWESYRHDISNNIELESAVHLSNQKLNTLFTRLTEVDPTYNQTFFKSIQQKEFDIKSVLEIQLTSSEKSNAIVDIINKEEQDNTYSLSHIDDLDFSSKDLEDTIIALKKGKFSEIRYVGNTAEDKISIKTSVVDLRRVKMRINIAIDGPSGSGKSSAAKAVSKRFGLKYINTGLVYRAIALNVLNKKIELSNEEEIIDSLEDSMIELLPNEVVFLKGNDVTKEVRRDDVSQTASKCAAISEVRTYALKIMQDTAVDKGVIMDGRDTTFRVLPEAELKFYVDTKAAVRAERRVEQNKLLGLDVNYNTVLEEIIERDERDESRETDPLQIVDDAIVIDSSNMSLEDVVEKISEYITNYSTKDQHE